METRIAAPDILLVDDMHVNLRILADMLKVEGMRTRSALSGEAALRAANAQPPDLVLLDVMMPDMDGYEVCRRLKATPSLAHIPVIFLSALDGTEDKVEAFAAGGVDYVTKPFQLDEVRARVQTHLRLRALQLEVEAYTNDLEALVCEQVEEIAKSQMATVFALARLAESRDDETGTHLERVQAFCRLLADGLAARGEHTVLDQNYVENLVHASLLHDIGKVAISDSVLLKPGSLTAEEFELMKTHTTLGSDTLEAVRNEYPNNAFLAMGIQVVRSHHERWDGSGYPDGLAQEEIPLCARIMAVADVYDAMRSKRVYKPPATHAECCEVILGGSGAHFDPAVVDAFREAQAEFDRVVCEAADKEPRASRGLGARAAYSPKIDARYRAIR